MIWFSAAMLLLSLVILVAGDQLLKAGHRRLMAEMTKVREEFIAEHCDAESIESRVCEYGRALVRSLRERAATADEETAARLRACADAVEQTVDIGRGKA
jgi:hypothetical protein